MLLELDAGRNSKERWVSSFSHGVVSPFLHSLVAGPDVSRPLPPPSRQHILVDSDIWYSSPNKGEHACKLFQLLVAASQGHSTSIKMGQVISWINSNLADDERQGEARQENQPQSLWGEIRQRVS